MRNLVIIITTVLAFYSCNKKTEFSQWRGENRDGIFNETNLLTTWPEEGPALKWEFEGIGNGYGSPAITSDRLYIQGEIDSIGYLFAFDLQGTLLWKEPYAKEWTLTFPGSRACPIVVDDMIYITSGLGNLSCFSAKEAKKLWSVD